MMKAILLLSFTLLPSVLAMSLRPSKNLPYFDYFTPEEYDYDMITNLEQNDISRTVPPRKPLNPYDSPIYYIRLPPQPYMFVPGLGYVSQPPPPSPMTPPMSPFLNLPLNFLANGKPSTIYQWDGTRLNGFENDQKPHKMPTKPSKGHTKPQKLDSTVHNLGGQFIFNGKPDNIMVLRDSYNSLYGDALQNFYP